MLAYRRTCALLAGLSLAAGSLAAGSLALPAAASGGDELAPVHPVPRSDPASVTHEGKGLWFVELDSPSEAEGSSQRQLRSEKTSFRESAREQEVDYTERMSFDTLWNGLSVEVDSGDVTKLRELPEVSALYPVERVQIPQTARAEPELSSALAMTGADAAQSELGLTGDGLRVAVMDTGIDYTHPDLGGPGEFPNERVVAGFDFVGDEFNAGHPDTLDPQPDPDPMDCNGHGTHVGGIVGAAGEVTGVAPEVDLGAYKVFGCDGSTTADVMIAAMEQALADDMDVLNMSIGSAFSWPQYPTAVASDALVGSGMTVVASIGNSGADGVYSAGAPGLGEDVIGVASFDNTDLSAQTFEVDPGGETVPYMPMPSAEPPPTEGSSPELAFLGRGCVDSAGDEHETDPDGKVALLERGQCPFGEKYAGALEAGAEGVLIHNDVSGLFSGGGIEDLGAFALAISDVAGEDLRERLDDGQEVTLDWTDELIEVPNPDGGLISSFSSFGLSPDLALKPDIGAPGGLIRSTLPMDQGEFATVSGTSMSSPHVAGAAALLLEAQPDLPAPEVRLVLQNSAEPAPWSGNADVGLLDNAHRQGAGMLDVPAAVEASTALAPAKIELGETAGEASRQALRITNDGDEAATYTLLHTPAVGTHGSTFTPSFNSTFAQVAFDQDEVTVEPGRHVNVGLSFTAPPEDFAQMQYGGYIVVDEADGAEYRVPYAGYAGDYQAIQAMAPLEEIAEDGEVVEREVPWLTRIAECDVFIEDECVEGGEFDNQPDGASFTMATVDGLPDIPYLLVHFAHQVQELEMVVFDAETERPVHPTRNKAVDLSHVERNASSASFFTYPWDGTVTGLGDGPRDVPEGDYRIEIRALKALGDPRNEEHWETWTSPVITLDRR